MPNVWRMIYMTVHVYCIDSSNTPPGATYCESTNETRSILHKELLLEPHLKRPR
jgi:hypothetical protein